jgi:hypothetical protein
MLHELFASLEALDTQTTAIRQFLKDKGIATDQDFAPYLEQAGNASSVRWLAVRVRIDHLLSSVIKPAGQDATAESPKPTENTKREEANAAANNSEKKEDQKKEETVSQETKKQSPATEHASADDKPHPQEVSSDEKKIQIQKPENIQEPEDKKNRNAA